MAILVAFLAGTASAQSPTVYAFAAPVYTATHAVHFGSTATGTNMLVGEVFVPKPANAGYLWVARIHFVYTSAMEAYLTGVNKHWTKPAPYASQFSEQTQCKWESSNIGGISSVISNDPNHPDRRAFSYGGSSYTGFFCYQVHFGDSNPHLLRWGLYANNSSLPGHPADRVAFWYVELVVFPPVDAMSTEELILYNELRLTDPDNQDGFSVPLTTFDDVLTPYDAFQGAKAQFGDAIAENDWHKTLTKGDGGTGTAFSDWNYHIPVYGTAGSTLDLNPDILGSSLSGPYASTMAEKLSGIKVVIRGILLIGCYSLAAKRVVNMLLEIRLTGTDLVEEEDD